MKPYVRFIQAGFEWISCREDNNNIRKLLLFFTLSVCLLVAYGINTVHLLMYNLDVYEILNNSEKYKEVYSWYYQNAFIPLFTNYLSFILQAPLPLLLASLAGKVVIFFLVYKISNIFLRKREYAYFLSVYFILSGLASHGLVHNEIFGPPLFTRAMMVSIIILSGVYLWLKNKYVGSSILLGLSVYIHPLYTVTSITFLGFGLASLVFFNKLKIKKLILPLVIIGLNIFCAAIMVGENGLVSVENQATFHDWHAFLKTSNAEDMFLWWTFAEFGYVLIPLLLASWVLFHRNERKEVVDSIFIGCLIGLCLMLVLEFTHMHGLFFGKVSELFIVSDLRRGIWVLLLFSFIILFRFFEQNEDSIVNNNSKLISLIMFLTAYLSANPLIVIFFVAVSSILRRSMTTLLIAVSLMVFVYFTSEYSSDPVEMNYILIKFFLMSFVAVVSYYSLDYCFKDGNPKRITHVFSIVVFLYIGLLMGRGLVEGRFISKWELIANGGPFSRIDHGSVLDYYYKNRYPKDMVQNDRTLVKKIIASNKNHDYILLPPEMLDARDRSLFQSSIFFDVIHINQGMFSKKGYDLWEKKMEILFGKEGKEKIIKTLPEMKKIKFQEYLGELYRNIPFKKFIDLNLKHGARFVVTDRRYDGVVPLILGDKFVVYDMNEY